MVAALRFYFFATILILTGSIYEIPPGPHKFDMERYFRDYLSSKLSENVDDSLFLFVCEL